MRISVTGATGTVGREVVRALLYRGADVRALVHRQTPGFPAAVEIVGADMARPETLGAVFEGVEGVFLVVPDGPDVVAMGLRAVEAAKAAGARRIVYISVARADMGVEIDSMRGKLPIEQAVRDSGMAYTILQPNNFYQNDRFFRREISEIGVYPQPLGNVGMNRVDVRDIADAAVNALLGSGREGKTYSLHGPDALTGEATAAIYTGLLGREVRYTGDPDEWLAQSCSDLPEWMITDFRDMNDCFRDHGLRATPEELAAQREAIGHEPRRFEDYAADLVAGWAAGVG